MNREKIGTILQIIAFAGIIYNIVDMCKFNIILNKEYTNRKKEYLELKLQNFKLQSIIDNIDTDTV